MPDVIDNPIPVRKRKIKILGGINYIGLEERLNEFLDENNVDLSLSQYQESNEHCSVMVVYYPEES